MTRSKQGHVHARPRVDWRAMQRAVGGHLLVELCRVFHSSERAMLCALSHGQVSIDGYVIRAEHLKRWPPERLTGRMASLCGRQARLYGGSRRDG